METRRKEKRFLISLLGPIFLLSFLPFMVFADIPRQMNYQGYLTDSGGTAINGSVSMQFSIYDTPTGGTVLWTETQSVPVSNGIYSVNLGEVTPIHLPFDVPYYLGVKVGADPEMTPRRALTSVPYAFRTKTVEKDQDTLGGLDCTSGQVPKWNGSVWVCGNDEAGEDGSTPSSTVVTLDGSSSAGTSSEYSRGDHKHGIGTGAITTTHILDQTITNTDISATAAIDFSKLSGVSSSTHHHGWTDDGAVVRLSTVTDSVGIGTNSPQQKLHVAGVSRFDVGGGQINISTPGGWPGIIMYSQNGHRRDVAVKNGGVHLEVSSSSSAPPEGNGITITENNGNVGVGTINPQQKLHVQGGARFDVGDGQINMSTPGGWPGIIMYSPNGHRRDLIIYDSSISLVVSSSSSPSSEHNGVKIYENGHVSVPVLEILGGSDLSEQFEIRKLSDEISPKPGMVVVIDPETPGKLIVSSKAYDRKAAGIISGAGGLKPGMLMGQRGSMADGTNPVALTGRVYCWADAANGPIEVGDLLTTSETPGHAMKVIDYTRSQGATVGKAMTALTSGRGLILVLVTLQ